jgi:molybdopterin molybdotransferase
MTLVEGLWDDAFAIARDSFTSLPTQSIALSDAYGRVLGADMSALCNLPAFETSSMDGWVVNGDGPWKIIGEVKTGQISGLSLGPSQCLAIATGGVIPDGGQAVVAWEAATERDGFIHGTSEVGANIRPAGAESKKGELLISAGTQLNAPKIGLLAAAGHDDVVVTRRPRIAIFFLGDELMHSGVPVDGLVRDALGPQLPAMLSAFGADVAISDFVTDDLDELVGKISSAINSQNNEIDMVITTGGTADGPRDFIKSAIAAFAGEYLIDRVKVRPGYHILLAKIASQKGTNLAFLALPGNPQSAIAALISFGRPIIDAMRGLTPAVLVTVQMSQEMKVQEGFARLVPSVIGNNICTPTNYLSSHMLRGVGAADGFALVSEAGPTRWLPIPQ